MRRQDSSFTRGASPLGLPNTLSARRGAGALPPALKLRWTGRSRLPTIAAAVFNAAKVGGSLARSLAARDGYREAVRRWQLSDADFPEVADARRRLSP